MLHLNLRKTTKTNYLHYLIGGYSGGGDLTIDI
jgi:hypothetical protein